MVLFVIMIITGLGNPGEQYAKTRHNAGFWAVDALAKRFRTEIKQKSHNSHLAQLNYRGQKHFLQKPLTYMNLSGKALASLMQETSTPPSEVLVIVDDINLPTGRLRLRASGNDGGHNGLKSIIDLIGTNFWRLRIGVGQPAQPDLVNHVLGELTPNEETIIQKVIAQIPEIAILWLINRPKDAMTKFNGVDFSAGE